MIEQVRKHYSILVKRLISAGYTISTMESCTGGMVSSLLTDTEGASEIFMGAFVTYRNHVKVALGVPKSTINQYGVYSAETAASMAESCRKNLATAIGIGITGTFSNQDPNNDDSVPGLVFYSISFLDNSYVDKIEISELKDRMSYKLYTADIICCKLMEILDCMEL